MGGRREKGWEGEGKEGRGMPHLCRGIKDPSPTKTDEPTEVPFGM